MRVGTGRIWTLAALAVLLLSTASAELDPSVQPVPASNATSVRWENIHSAPLWIDGPRPEVREHPWYPLYRSHSYLHEIDLEPGKTATIQLPRNSVLRVLATRRDTLRLEDLTVETSNGTGLLIRESLRRGPDDNTVILGASTHAERLVRITRPKNYVGRVHVALFVSKTYTPAPVDEHTDLIHDGLEEVAIRRDFEATPTSWWSLPSDKAAEFDIEGPTTLVLKSRVRYRRGDPNIQRRTQIDLALNGNEISSLRIDSAPDSRHLVEVDSCIDSVGRIETHAIKIPDGKHRLRLDPSQSLYVRIKRRSSKPYLFADANRPDDLDSSTPWIDPKFDWRSAAVDNSRRGSALAVAQDLREIATGDVRQIRLASLSNQLLDGYGFWRDVLPENLDKHAELSRRTFSMPVLATYSERQRQRVIHESLARAQSTDSNSGWFSTHTKSATFMLPERKSDSRIRLLIDATRVKQPVDLTVRFNDESARRLKVLPADALHLDRLRPSVAGQTRRLMDGVTGSHPRRNIASLILPVRAHVRSVTIESDDTSVPVAFQFRASRPGGLWENEFLRTIELLGQGRAYAELKRALVHAVSPDHVPIALPATPGKATSSELINHLRPMLRLVRARSLDFAAGVETPELTTRLSEAQQDNSIYSEKLGQAKALESDGALVAALETYTEAARHEPATGPHTATLARVGVLRQLGEHMLANRVLRGMFKYSDHPSQRTAAWRQMDREADSDSATRLRLAVVRLRYDFSDVAILNLISRLSDDGHYTYALSAALTLPDSLRPLDLIRESAAATGWWTALDQINERSGTASDTAFWNGVRERRFGAAQAAEAEFKRAETNAQPWLASLREEIRVSERIRSEDLTPELIEDWATTRYDAPGRRYYRPANDFARNAAGGVWLYAIERDLGGTWFRSQKTHPLEIEVIGPKRLRVSARLVHPDTPETGIDNWLMIASGDHEQHLAVLGDMPSPGLKVTGSTDQAGRLNQAVISIGPGLQRLRFYPRDGQSFYRIEEEAPLIDSGVLPAITDDSVGVILDEPNRDDDTLRGAVWLTRECELFDGENQSIDWKDRWLRGRQIPRVHSMKTASAATTISSLVELIKPGKVTPPVIESPVPDPVHEILWALDNEETTLERALTDTLTATPADDLARRYRLTSAIKKRATGAWKYISNVAASAGLHTVEVDRWSPEHPSLRIRQSLMPSLGADEALLTGGREMVIALDNLSPTELVADLALSEVLYQLESPLIVQWAVDDDTWNDIQLDHSNRKQRLEVSMKSGAHALKVRVKKGVANQYLRVRVRERRNGELIAVERDLDKSWQVATTSEPVLLNVKGPSLLRIDKRIGDLVTSKIQRVDDGWQKLKFDAKETSENVLYRFHKLVPGAGTPPVPLATAPRQRTPVAFAKPAIVRPLTEPVLKLQDRYDLGKQEDGTWSHWLGYRYDQSSPNEDLQDLPSEIAPSDRYFEYSLTKRKYSDASPVWFARRWTRFGGILRIRPDGSPTIGAHGRIDWRFKDRPLAVFVEGEVFAQKLEERIDPVTPMSVQLSAGVSQTRYINDKTWHVPSASLTLRSTSPDEFRKGQTELVDRDVYTAYRRTHECAVRVGDTLYHKPWLDTLWYASASATTNPCFNPFDIDRIGGRVGWRQMYGPFEFDGQYFLRHSFNDDDREESTTSHGFRVEANWNKWAWNQQRFQVKGWWDHDFGDHSDSVYLGVGLHFSHGRQYRDFRPSEVRFRELKEARIPRDPNNIIRGAYDD